MTSPAPRNGFLILITPHKNELVAPLLAAGLTVLWVLDVMQSVYTFFRDKVLQCSPSYLHTYYPLMQLPKGWDDRHKIAKIIQIALISG